LINITATDSSPPSVTLDAPTSYQNLSISLTYFNFTATDVSGLDTCQLWGNWTGTWHNNYSWVGPTSGVQNFTSITLSDTRAKYNVWCNDTRGFGGYSTSNLTFTVDTTNPNITISTANASTSTVRLAASSGVNPFACEDSFLKNDSGMNNGK